MITTKAAFLDRDGTIIKDVRYLSSIDDIELIPSSIELCKQLQELGYTLFIITNQSGVARGYYQEEDFHILTKWMLAQFNNRDIDILDVFFCPHGPKSTCKCRKPQPGMFLEARDKYDINLENSWMIGDKETDITAANAAGVNNTILVRSGHIVDEVNTKAKFILDSIKDSIQIVT